MSITAKELAQKLNLSAAAVSMALNNKPGVSTQTRKMVLEEAQRLGYNFDRIKAKEENRMEQGNIYFVVYRKHGALVPESAEPSFFTQLSEGISQSCKEVGYHLHISYLYADDNVAAQLKEWANFGLSGILLLGTEMDRTDLTIFQQSGIPFVLIDNYFDDLNTDSVIMNNVQGAFLATNYLIRRCHSQPGYLKSTYRFNGFNERADGFYKAIRQNGMSTARSQVVDLSPTVEGAYEDMKLLLQQNPDAPISRCFFADNDLIAAGAMRALIEAGYRIPEDVAIVGFDDMPLCTYVNPPLTTVHVPKQYMGDLAVKRLVEIVKNKSSLPVKIEVGTTLVKRRSC